MKAHDWEADNMAQVDGTDAEIDNPGGYDAVNRYGDEDTDGNLNDVSTDFNQNYLTYFNQNSLIPSRGSFLYDQKHHCKRLRSISG